jgi:hypothetical protein
MVRYAAVHFPVLAQSALMIDGAGKVRGRLAEISQRLTTLESKVSYLGWRHFSLSLPLSLSYEGKHTDFTLSTTGK